MLAISDPKQVSAVETETLEDGKVMFKFDPVVALEYGGGRIHSRLRRLDNRLFGFNLLEDDQLVPLVDRMLKKELPAYLGKNRFYETRMGTFSALDEYGDEVVTDVGGRPFKGKFFFFRSGSNSENNNATLEVRLNHSESFDSSTGISTIEALGGEIGGFVPIKIKIPYQSAIGTGAVAEVVAAVLYERPPLSEDRKDIVEDWGRGIYLPIANPTAERMEQVIEHARRISEYFKQNMGTVQRAALAIQEADAMRREGTPKIVSAETLMRDIRGIESETEYFFQQARYMLNLKFNEKLGSVAADIATLAQSFPRELMANVSPQFYKKRDSFSQ